MQLRTEHGRITDIRFYGDFLSSRSLEELEAALQGCPYIRRAVEETLSRFPLYEYFGAIAPAELFGTIMNEG